MIAATRRPRLLVHQQILGGGRRVPCRREDGLHRLGSAYLPLTILRARASVMAPTLWPICDALSIREGLWGRYSLR